MKQLSKFLTESTNTSNSIKSFNDLLLYTLDKIQLYNFKQYADIESIWGDVFYLINKYNFFKNFNQTIGKQSLTEFFENIIPDEEYKLFKKDKIELVLYDNNKLVGIILNDGGLFIDGKYNPFYSERYPINEYFISKSDINEWIDLKECLFITDSNISGSLNAIVNNIPNLQIGIIKL